MPEVLRSKVGVFVELSRNAALLREQAAVLREQARVLQKAEHKFRSLLEAAPDAMAMCTGTGEIIMANSRIESLFQDRRENLLGKHIRTLVPDWTFDLLPVPDEDLSKAILDLSPAVLELHAVCSDGTSFPVEITFSPLQTEDGVLITHAIRDITERKKAAEKIQQLNEHLEERIRERTEDLLRSNEELQQFAYIASHDLREPLRTVSVFTQLPAKRYGDSGGDAGELISTIVENSKRMEHLIRDLLDFSRVDVRGADFFKPVDCNQVLEQAERNLHSSIEETATAIKVDRLPTVIGDSMQLNTTPLLFAYANDHSLTVVAQKPMPSRDHEGADTQLFMTLCLVNSPEKLSDPSRILFQQPANISSKQTATKRPDEPGRGTIARGFVSAVLTRGRSL
ncbi:MAG: sensor histidine kinase [Bryobacteraceae bacterium]